MAPETILDPFINDPVIKGQGLLARFLVGVGESLGGTRLIDVNAGQYKTDTGPGLKTFYKYVEARLTNIRRHYLPDGKDEWTGSQAANENKRPDIKLTDAAYRHWVEFYNHVETLSGPEGEYQDIYANAAKMAEQVARIAGVMAVLEGARSVTVIHIKDAIGLGNYYLAIWQYLGSKAAPGSEERAIADAALLMGWFQEKGFEVVSTRYITQKAPRSTGCRGNTAYLRQVMTVLVDNYHAAVVHQTKSGLSSKWLIR
jgi:hypothetical protein